MIYSIDRKQKTEKELFGYYYEAGNERSDADGAENEARSAYDTIDGDSPASHPRPSGKN